MKIGRYADARIAVVERDSVRDITEWAFASSTRHTEDPMLAAIDALKDGCGNAEGRSVPAPVRWRAPLAQPSKIIAAAANYERHTREMNPGVAAPGGVREKGFFLKAPTSIIGPDETIRLPFADRRTDHEAELAVVMGRRARHVAPEAALEHVFGYTCLLDITVRGKEDRGLRKSFDTFTPMGPWIVTRDEIADPNALAIACRVNGVARQDDSTSAMTMKVPELIAWISSVMTLLPGDVIATGTPAGVGPLAPGDRIEVEIEKIGAFGVDVASA